ncbi:hypothetical protein [Streptacidiphilus sp. P02-A3a]|uniref:hypothetical protein n=1 Tax=Streptacidiphilus sp. P02-A3a TaxID=2704468 RepID=UPI001CDD08BC|nr:hypothetical protein [Streptacidiphilus sp. P02-A3a]
MAGPAPFEETLTIAPSRRASSGAVTAATPTRTGSVLPPASVIAATVARADGSELSRRAGTRFRGRGRPGDLPLPGFSRLARASPAPGRPGPGKGV